MEQQNNYKFTPLAEPIPITEQDWPEGTLPLVHTRTLTFMHEKYISECIEGILMQRTTFPVQVLIHDDASTDRTVEIVREYEKKYPRLIKAYYQTENSYSKPDAEERRSEFFKWRIGEYEAICEGDDYWTDPYKLQKQVDLMENNPEFSMCFHNSLIIYENGNIKPHLFTTINKEEFDIQDIIINNWFIPTPSIFFRIHLYDRPGWASYVFGGDLVMQLMLATKGNIGVINEVMATYRKHHKSRSANKKIGFHQLKIIETLSFFNYYTNFQYNSIIQRKISSLREELYISFIAKLPFWNRIVNPDFIKNKLKTLQQKNN
jgi:glycosyltransferase involved in cell wall biosynthesis